MFTIRCSPMFRFSAILISSFCGISLAQVDNFYDLSTEKKDPTEKLTYSDKPLFTDFTYDNLGVPKNPENPFYTMDEVLVDGKPINPAGENWIDSGLGGYLKTTIEWASYADINIGKFKVPTLRNVDKRPGTHFTKAFTHNGFFKSLKEIVHFYNTRDVESWPPPEVLLMNCLPDAPHQVYQAAHAPYRQFFACRRSH